MALPALPVCKHLCTNDALLKLMNCSGSSVHCLLRGSGWLHSMQPAPASLPLVCYKMCVVLRQRTALGVLCSASYGWPCCVGVHTMLLLL